jgi:hypothetical protein
MSSLNKTFVICKKASTMSLSFIQDVKFSKNTKHHKLTRDNGEDGEVNFFFSQNEIPDQYESDFEADPLFSIKNNKS